MEITSSKAHHSHQQSTEIPIHFLFLLAIMLVGIPLMLSPFDFWDGRILSHAIETRQENGMHSWAYSSGWVLQYYLLKLAQWIEVSTGFSADLQLRLLIILSLCGVVYEATRFVAETLRLPKHWAMIAGIAVVAFSGWNVLLSTAVIFMYILCTWLSLLAVRWIFQRGVVTPLLGVLILLPSFQLNSNFVFSIALAGVYLASGFVYERSVSRHDVMKFLLIFVISLVAFIALKSNFTPSGIYANYNSVGIPSTLSEIMGLGIEMVRYFQYPILITLAVLSTHLLLFLLVRLGLESRLQATSLEVFPVPHSRELLWPLLVSIFLIASAAFPYVMVGKAADLRMLFSDWNPRHTFLMAMPIGLFLASLARWLSAWHGLREANKTSCLPAAAAVLALIALQQASFWCKLSRAAYESKLISVLAEQTPPPAGLLKIVVSDFPEARLRSYESNWLLAQAYGEEKWLSGLVHSKEEEVDVSEWMEQDLANEGYRSQFIMRDFKPGCETTIFIEGEPFGPSEVLPWLIWGKALPDNLSISRQESRCETLLTKNATHSLPDA